MTPDWYPHDDWDELSETLQHRAATWHAKPDTLRRLDIRIEANAVAAMMADRTELRKLRAERDRRALAAMERYRGRDATDDDGDEDVGEDVAEKAASPAIAAEPDPEPPAGKLPPPPKTLSNAIWPFKVYDYMANQPGRWITAGEMMKAMEARGSAVHSGLKVLKRNGAIVHGPRLMGDAGRTMDSYQLARQ